MSATGHRLPTAHLFPSISLIRWFYLYTTTMSSPRLSPRESAGRWRPAFPTPDPSTSSTVPTSEDLRFRPIAGRDYAKTFALAVRDSYQSGSLGQSGKDLQLVWAYKIIDGEGGDLVFRPGYIDTLRTKIWNGNDERVRRGAFLHILGSTTEQCKFVDCQWKLPGVDAVCHPCQENRGHFEGCRHEHGQIGRNGQCGNCAANCTPGNCTFCQLRRETTRKRKSEFPQAERNKKSHRVEDIRAAAPESTIELVNEFPASGPYISAEFPKREPKETSKNVFRRMQRAVADMESPCLLTEVRWMEKYTLLLLRQWEKTRLSMEIEAWNEKLSTTLTCIASDRRRQYKRSSELEP